MPQRAHAWNRRKNHSFSITQKRRGPWYSKEAKSQRLDAIPKPPKPYPSPKHHTRESQASAHGKIKCTLNRRGSQNPVSIKTPTRPSVHPWHPKALPRVRPPYQPPTSNQQPICPESFWSPFIMLNTVDTIDKMATGCQTTKTNVYTHGPQTTLH